jgi:hypothetical protein
MHCILFGLFMELQKRLPPFKTEAVCEISGSLFYLTTIFFGRCSATRAGRRHLNDYVTTAHKPQQVATDSC